MKGKFKNVLVGVLLGAAGMYVALQYHIVRANEGFLMVRRTPQQGLPDAYADIRQWSTGTWTAHSNVSLALAEGGRSDLIVDQTLDKASEQLQESLGTAAQRGNQGWEPAMSSRSANGIGGSSIRTGAQQPTNNTERKPSPWASLFGIRPPSGNTNVPAQRTARPTSVTPILPTGQRNGPTVEILPSPDEVDLGRSAPLPNGTQRRYPQRTSWEAVTPDRRAEAPQAEGSGLAIHAF